MKFHLLFGILLFLMMPLISSAQLAFGVSPGFNLNSAYVGYKFNEKLMGTFGLQYYSTSYKFEEDGFEDVHFSAAVIVPTLGLKYFLLRQNQIQPYLNLNLSKPFVSGKLEYDDEVDEDFEEIIDNINLLGVAFGFGVEYFFDNNFSIGGEYGFQYMKASYDSSDDFGDINFSGSFNPTYTRMTLNYYFPGKE